MKAMTKIVGMTNKFTNIFGVNWGDHRKEFSYLRSSFILSCFTISYAGLYTGLDFPTIGNLDYSSNCFKIYF